MTRWYPIFNSALPGWTLVLAAVVLGIAVCFLLRRERNANRWENALRIAATLLLFSGFAQLTLVECRVPALGVLLISDDSLSMTLPVREDTKDTRQKTAQKIIPELKRTLESEGLAVEIRTVSELAGISGNRMTEDVLTGVLTDVSPLGTALETALRTEFWGSAHPARLSGVFLLSDGVVTQGPALAETSERAKIQKCTVFTAALGGTRPVPQILLEWENPQTDVLAGENMFFRLKTHTESLAGRKFTLRLSAVSRDGNEEKNVLAEQTVEPRDERNPDGNSGKNTASVLLKWKPETPGEYRLVFETEILQEKIAGKKNETREMGKTGETEKIRRIGKERDENDVKKVEEPFLLHPPLEFTLHAAPKVRKVLLITAVPDWEYRFLRNLLAREKTVSLETWTPPDAPLAPDPEQDAVQRKDFPTAEELEDFDVVILNSVSPDELGVENAKRLTRFLTQTSADPENAENAAYSTRGFIFIAGKTFRPDAWNRAEAGKLFPLSFIGITSENKCKTPHPLSLTSAGKNAPQFQKNASSDFSTDFDGNSDEILFPEIFRFYRIPHLLSGAEVLAETDGAPIVIRGRGGNVNTIFHATENFWRWRKSDEDAYRRYWVQTIHGLCQDSGERLNSRKNPHSESLQEPPFESSDRTEKRTHSSLYSTRNREFQQTSADREALNAAAEISGGILFEPVRQSVPEIAREVILTLKTDAQRRGNAEFQVRYFALWNRLPFWFIFFFILTVLWCKNRRSI